MATSSAPGKLMLFGEHAVVYGHPCIVTAVDSRLRVTVTPTSDGNVSITAPQVNNTRFVDAALTAGCHEWRISHTGLAVTTESDFPCTFGFGSSSAVTVAALHALATAFGKPVTPRDLFTLAYRVVLAVQGVGSGFDVASAVYGGTLAYVVGGKRLDPIDSAPPIVIGYTGQKADTATIVREVAKKREAYPDRVDRIMAAIAQLTDQAEAAMRGGDWERTGKLMTFNQEYLRDLGVSTQKLEELIAAATGAGAYGAKLSGAGGGDCMVALVDPGNRAAVEAAIAAAGGEVVKVGVHASGVGAPTTDNGQELFTVVDEQDRVVGYRTRAECHRDPSLIHRVVGVAVFDSSGRILLQKRSMTKDMEGGLWSVTSAGHVLKDESYEDAAKRELAEEVGIDIPIAPAAGYLYQTGAESEMSRLFTATYDGPVKPDPTEVAEIRPFTRDEVVRGLLSGDVALTESSRRALKLINFL
jgi:mevalonate kinase